MKNVLEVGVCVVALLLLGERRTAGPSRSRLAIILRCTVRHCKRRKLSMRFHVGGRAS